MVVGQFRFPPHSQQHLSLLPCSPFLWYLLPFRCEPRWLAEWAQRSREGSEDRAANDFVIVHSPLQADGRCDVGDCLEKLYSMGFRSLMVEVGSDFFSGRCPRLCRLECSSTHLCLQIPLPELSTKII